MRGEDSKKICSFLLTFAVGLLRHSSSVSRRVFSLGIGRKQTCESIAEARKSKLVTRRRLEREKAMPIPNLK